MFVVEVRPLVTSRLVSSEVGIPRITLVRCLTIYVGLALGRVALLWLNKLVRNLYRYTLLENC